jgi:two-component system, NtrC family, sensor histidine kinase HydH
MISKISHLSLRWRLIIAFLAVSVVPVLVSSYVAAEIIQKAFEQTLAQWLGEAGQFFAARVTETRKEAESAADIVAKSLNNKLEQYFPADETARPFADLLTLGGYDLVKVYDDQGKAEFVSGAVDLNGQAPPDGQSVLTKGRLAGREVLLVGATRSFEGWGRRHHVFVGSLVTEKLFGEPGSVSSLNVRVFSFQDGRLFLTEADANANADAEADHPVSAPVATLEKLAKGTPIDVVQGPLGGYHTTAYSGLYDTEGHLLGVITCRLSGSAALFEKLGEWALFASLAAVAGVLSLFVAILVSRRIARPVRALTKGLRAVAAGDFKARVPEETGGRELSELAKGFNVMAEQLERLKRMENEMRKRQQFAALGEAAAVIAHEIRNPLGIIRTSSEVVRMKSPLAPAEDRLIGFVLEEVARIDRLVQDILDYVRPREPRREMIDLRDVVSRVIDVARPALVKKRIADVVANSNGPLRIEGDPDRLHQALLNLVLNAMDAMPDGGKLEIDAGLDGEQIRITVQDNGIGMAEDVRKRVFDPFFTTKTRGTGLGLAKVQTIIEEHGGSIRCDSAPSRGATFTIHLTPGANKGRSKNDGAVDSGR